MRFANSSFSHSPYRRSRRLQTMMRHWGHTNQIDRGTRGHRSNTVRKGGKTWDLPAARVGARARNITTTAANAAAFVALAVH